MIGNNSNKHNKIKMNKKYKMNLFQDLSRKQEKKTIKKKLSKK
jgi:hypothetical protein